MDPSHKVEPVPFVSFRCGECPGTVGLRSAEGLQWEFLPRVAFPIPADIMVPRCDQCGEVYYRSSDEALITERLKPVEERQRQLQLQFLVQQLCDRHKINAVQLGYACGLTWKFDGATFWQCGVPSRTLVRLLEAFRACPAELDRHLGRRSTFETWKRVLLDIVR